MLIQYVKPALQLTRMPIVLAVLPTFFLGSLFALIVGAEFHLANFLWGFAILFLIEIATSYANDYFDFEADSYNQQFGFSGGSGVLIKYPELRPFAKWMAISLMILALFLCLLFIIATGFSLWILGYIAVALFFCWFYTAPPLRLVYRGLGELPHLLGGIMFAGWGYIILVGSLDISLLVFALPLGILGLTVILNFEIPDREADMHGGKKNIVVGKGRPFTFTVILLLYVITSLYYLALAMSGWLSNKINFWIVTLISVLPLVFASHAALQHPSDQTLSTSFTIRTAVSLFVSLIVFTMYLVIVAT